MTRSFPGRVIGVFPTVEVDKVLMGQTAGGRRCRGDSFGRRAAASSPGSGFEAAVPKKDVTFAANPMPMVFMAADGGLVPGTFTVVDGINMVGKILRDEIDFLAIVCKSRPPNGEKP